jgi:hypothetical protein
MPGLKIYRHSAAIPTPCQATQDLDTQEASVVRALAITNGVLDAEYADQDVVPCHQCAGLLYAVRPQA